MQDTENLQSIARQYAEARFDHVSGSEMARLERQLLDEIAEIGARLNYGDLINAYMQTDAYRREQEQVNRLLNR